MKTHLRNLLAAMLVLSLTSSLSADDAKKQPKPRSAGFPGLLTALKKSPGCIGVETAQTASGKGVIFAWFKNKKAAVAWYNSDYHQKMVKRFFPGSGGRTPLKNVPDNAGPIMAIASITFTKKPKFDATKLPISQISIELYSPLKGGLSLGGTFAPAKLKQHLRKPKKPKAVKVK